MLKSAESGPKRHSKSRIVGHSNRNFVWDTSVPYIWASRATRLGCRGEYKRLYLGEEAFV